MQCYSQCIRYDNRLTCEKGDQYEEITAYSGRCPGHIQYRMRQETLTGEPSA